VASEILCNKCGKSMHVPSGGAEPREPGNLNVYGIRDLVISGGENSPCITDCTSYAFDLCEPCVAALMDTFVLPPTLSSPETYAEDRARLSAYRAESKTKDQRRKEHSLGGFCTDESDPSLPGQASQQKICTNKATYSLVYRPGSHRERLEDEIGAFQVCDAHVFGSYHTEATIAAIGPERQWFDPPRTQEARRARVRATLAEAESPEIRGAYPAQDLPALLFLAARAAQPELHFHKEDVLALRPAPTASVTWARVYIAMTSSTAGRLPPPLTFAERTGASGFSGGDRCACPRRVAAEQRSIYAYWRLWAYRMGLANELLMGEEQERDEALLHFYGEPVT
jgi:hypothetical protein